ncbi:MAG: hypothetical protein AB4911_01780 [Oscillochloridaceae bacterium umkhey_bin13]
MVLRQAVDCTRLSFNLYPSGEAFLPQFSEIIADQDPNYPHHQNLTFRKADVPPSVVAILQRGGVFSGHTATSLPVDSKVRQHFERNGV